VKSLAAEQLTEVVEVDKKSKALTRNSRPWSSPAAPP
jgi:hypothetical protein